jgi:hypothetical protein
MLKCVSCFPLYTLVTTCDGRACERVSEEQRERSEREKREREEREREEREKKRENGVCSCYAKKYILSKTGSVGGQNKNIALLMEIVEIIYEEKSENKLPFRRLNCDASFDFSPTNQSTIYMLKYRRVTCSCITPSI